MIMPATIFLSRSARMKNQLSLGRRQAGDIKFLEGAGRAGRNFRPMNTPVRRDISRLAKSAIYWVVSELQSEQFDCPSVEDGLSLKSWTLAEPVRPLHKHPQSEGEL